MKPEEPTDPSPDDRVRGHGVADAAAGPTTNCQVQHASRLMLVDRAGMIRGTYNAVDEDAPARVTAHRALVDRR